MREKNNLCSVSIHKIEENRIETKLYWKLVGGINPRMWFDECSVGSSKMINGKQNMAQGQPTGKNKAIYFETMLLRITS